MAIRPQDLTVAKSDVAAETLAAAIWDAANQHDGSSAIAASVQRSLRRHARELLELHDIKAGEVLTTGTGEPRPDQG
ncbi:MAG TPA: hypothetical protein VK735_18845 [Pseudonocardia sp.]|uniref:hypothetical protein n=1 Tax=Pseudonocardia sp. TaxID=60912 RepID=UPI002BBACC7D|nr:hypothetical protein [Pseudonocardia sp.]HTF49506.1 hypothetical protein [Pseudonocardia sp.]